jgi:LuxR family transcriptional regulator, quorum-sensing system regulator BjaR1
VTTLSESIDAFEGATSIDQLKKLMQETIEEYGFAAFNFFDAGRPHLDEPIFFGTTGQAWENEYKQNNFVSFDPTLSYARRTNVGFTWREIEWPKGIARKKSGAMQLMEAATDHGFGDGYILPFHFVDFQGRNHSALCALFWKDENSRQNFVKSKRMKHELNLLLLYWTQCVLQLLGEKFSGRAVFREGNSHSILLSDRERQILAWAGRGHTASDTSEILKISTETVKTHIVHAIEKLGAINKTHAVAKAIQLGLIDL